MSSSPPSPPASCFSSLKSTLESLLYPSSADGPSVPTASIDRKDSPASYSPAFPMDVKLGLGADLKLTADAKKTLDKDAKILIFGGGGTMGSSTALHLARRGYNPSNITILDCFEIPSQQSAGADRNKIAGGGSRSGWRGKLANEIMKGWREDPVFSPYYHEVGRITTAHGSPERIANLRRTFEDLVRRSPETGESYEYLDTKEKIIEKMPQLANANIDGWEAYWVTDGGWVAAVDTIDSIGRELERLGVKTVWGAAGKFKKPLLSIDRTTCIGAECEDGTVRLADRVVFACGAWTPTLIDLEGQCVSKAWVMAHIDLTPEEIEFYRDMPVIYDDQLGFFFEASSDGKMKLCNEFAGYTRIIEHQPYGAEKPEMISVPRSHAIHESDSIPDEGLEDIKRLIATLLPNLVDRELVDAKMCWCTDTADAEWLFCEDPRWLHLFLATGDSGHSFNTIPYVGSEIADMLEGKMSADKQKAWGWRPGRGDPDHTGRGGPAPEDLKDKAGWAHGDPEDEV